MISVACTGLWYWVFQTLKLGVRALKLLVRGRNSSALQGRCPAGPEGFPAHAAFRMAHRTAIMAAAWRTEETLRPTQNLLNSH